MALGRDALSNQTHMPLSHRKFTTPEIWSLLVKVPPIFIWLPSFYLKTTDWNSWQFYKNEMKIVFRFVAKCSRQQWIFQYCSVLGTYLHRQALKSVLEDINNMWSPVNWFSLTHGSCLWETDYETLKVYRDWRHSRKNITWLVYKIM